MPDGDAALPRAVETVVIGGGVAGSVVAGRLAAASDESILLLEAGPDYGPRTSGAWPADLLAYGTMPVTSHSWGYLSAATHGTPQLSLQRARVIGGCSSHNGCAAVWGHRADYDAWAAAGNDGWDMESLRPRFVAADRAMRVFQPAREEVTPWHRACLDAAPAAGFPLLPSINDVDAELGIGIGALNVAEGVRWNAAFGYLDPVRDRPNLRIAGDVIVDRIEVTGGRATAVDLIHFGTRRRVEANRIVLAGGAYGSPLVLLRSGIGPADEMRPLGIEPVHDVPGVGRNLQDHPATWVSFAGTAALAAAMDDFVAGGGPAREEGTIVLARSRSCAEAFDLHLYPIGTPLPDGGWRFAIYAAVMTPRSAGSVRLSGRDPEAPPVIDHGYFTDEGDLDLRVLADGLRLAREVAARPPLAALAGPEIEPCRDGEELIDHIRRNGVHDYHPVGTCKMGPASDPTAVVDAAGRVHGLDGLYVADAAIMPIVPRANTNIPTAAVAEKIAAGLIASSLKPA